MLTIAYLTHRTLPMFQWFRDSLDRQCHSNYTGMELIIVDFYAPRKLVFKGPTRHIAPKPCVWQGRRRLTNANYYAGASVTNTVAIAAQGDYVVWVSDLSVLLPGWLDAVREAESAKRIICGRYAKVKGLTVEHGIVQEYIYFHRGRDTRDADLFKPSPCGGGWLYGCCFGMPLDVFLSVNGADECCDGMGCEDVYLGSRLEKAGHQLYYEPRMMLLESEELHSPDYGPVMPRNARPILSYESLAYEMLDYVRENSISRGTGDLCAARQVYQTTGKWPQPTPAYLWPDGQTTWPEAFVK